MNGFIKSHGKYLTFSTTIGFLVLAFNMVSGSCPKQAVRLWAVGGSPVTENFSDYKRILSLDSEERCRWIISSSTDDTSVTLKFSNFELKSSSKGKSDCVEIYDGDEEEAKNRLDKLCNKMPQKSYSSSGRQLLVVYERGEENGNRTFSMIYYSHQTSSKEKIIQIAGIFGAVVAAIAVVYVILKVTKCCRCLQRKNNTDNVQITQERDRLVLNVEQAGDTLRPNPNNTTNANTSGNASAPPLSSQDVVVNNEHEQESDTDSFQDLNELPPSYESLYLNELGESVRPPDYSPPRHRTTHPPRRVNTFN